MTARFRQPNFKVSIHAPVMDAKPLRCNLDQLRRFNPRARDGREYIVEKILEDVKVSIHAPVMDANFFDYKYLSIY